MPRKEYNELLDAIKNAEEHISRLQEEIRGREDAYAQRLGELAAMKQEVDTMYRLREQYVLDLQFEHEVLSRSEDSLERHVTMFSDQMPEKMFDVAKEFEERKGDSVLPSITQLNRLSTAEEWLAASEPVAAMLKERSEKSTFRYEKIMYDYFCALQRVQPDCHNKANRCHIMRNQIKDLIKQFNDSHDKSERLPSSFTEMKEVRKKEMIFNDLQQRMQQVLGDKPELMAYFNDYMQYVDLENELGDRDHDATTKVDMEIEKDNITRRASYNARMGVIPPLSELEKMSDDYERYSEATIYWRAIDGIIHGYNFRVSRQAKIEAEKAISAVGNTGKAAQADDMLPFDSMSAYEQARDDLHDKYKGLRLDSSKKDKEKHEIRGEIRKLIADYNKAHQRDGNKLSSTFTDLIKLGETDYEKYTRQAGVIAGLIGGSEQRERLGTYFADFDAYVRLKHNVEFMHDKLKDLIEDENKKRKGIMSEMEKREKEIREVTTLAGYQAAVQEKSRMMQEEFEKELKDMEKDMSKAAFSKNIYSVASEAMSGISDRIKDAAVALCVAQAKGELKTLEDTIQTLTAEIAEDERALEASNRAVATNRQSALKGVSLYDVEANRVGGGSAIEDDDVNKMILKNARYMSDSAALVRDLAEKRKELDEIRAEYNKNLELKKAEVKSMVMGLYALDFATGEVDTSAEKLRVKIESSVSDKSEGIVDRAQRQAELNYQAGERARDEAEELARLSRDKLRAQRAEELGTKISAMFSQKNLERADTLASVVEKAVNIVNRSVKGADSGEDSPEVFDIGEKLDGLREKLDELNNPSQDKGEHIANRIVDVAQSLCTLAESIDDSFKAKAIGADKAYQLKKIQHQDLMNVRDTVESMKEASADAKNEPTFFAAKVKYVLNADAGMVDATKKRIDHFSACIDEIDREIDGAEKKISAMDSPLSPLALARIGLEDTRKKAAYVMDIRRENIVKYKEALEEERISTVLEAENTEVRPVEITREQLSGKNFKELGVISALSGVDLGEDPTNEQLREALDRIYINGITATQFFRMDEMMVSHKDDPMAIRDKFREIGDIFKEHFVQNLAPGDGSSSRKDPLESTILAVENEDFLLSPIVLKTPELENVPVMGKKPQLILPDPPKEPEKHTGLFSGRKNKELQESYNRAKEEYDEEVAAIRQRYEAEYAGYLSSKAAYEGYPYHKTLEFNRNNIDMCRDLNQSRIEAAKAVYDVDKHMSLNEGERSANVRRMALNEAVEQSKGRDIAHYKAARGAVQHLEKPQETKQASPSSPSL